MNATPEQKEMAASAIDSTAEAIRSDIVTWSPAGFAVQAAQHMLRTHRMCGLELREATELCRQLIDRARARNRSKWSAVVSPPGA